MFIKDTKKLTIGSKLNWLKLSKGSGFDWLVAKPGTIDQF